MQSASSRGYRRQDRWSSAHLSFRLRDLSCETIEQSVILQEEHFIMVESLMIIIALYMPWWLRPVQCTVQLPVRTKAGHFDQGFYCMKFPNRLNRPITYVCHVSCHDFSLGLICSGGLSAMHFMTPRTRLSDNNLVEAGKPAGILHILWSSG